jgi:hypothetical protein
MMKNPERQIEFKTDGGKMNAQNQKLKEWIQDHSHTRLFDEDFDERDGRLHVAASIELSPQNGGLFEIPENFNPIIHGDIDIWDCLKIGAGFAPVVMSAAIDSHPCNNKLDTELGENFVPVVLRDLSLFCVSKLPRGFNPIVGSCLNCYRVQSVAEGMIFLAGANILFHALTSVPKGCRFYAGKSVLIPRVTEVGEGFHVIAGDAVDVASLEKAPPNSQVVCGGILIANAFKSIPEDFDPLVAVRLLLEGCPQVPRDRRWRAGRAMYEKEGEWFYVNDAEDRACYERICEDGKELYYNDDEHEWAFISVWGDKCIKKEIYYNDDEHEWAFISVWGGKYVKIDGIFREVASHHGNVWKLRHPITGGICYAVSNAEKAKFAHGATLDEAIEEIRLKSGLRDSGVYSRLTLDSKLSFSEMQLCYRAITGACHFGVKAFIEDRETPLENREYSLREAIQLTKGAYGCEKFAEFFECKK